MRLVTWTFFAMGRFSARVSIVFTYLGAGTLRLAELKDAIRRSWEGFYGRDEDVASGLMEWERDLVDRFVPQGATVLVVGAGSGRDIIPLVERGCERHRRRARRRRHSRSPAVCCSERLSRPRSSKASSKTWIWPGSFDVVIFSFYSYSYIPQSRRRIAALRKAARSLTADGRILVSYPPLQAPHHVLIALGRAAGAVCRTDWRLEPGDLITAHSGGFRGYAHAFQSGELTKEGCAAGLRCVFRSGYPDPVAVLAAEMTTHRI